MGRVINAWSPFLLGLVIEVVTDPTAGWFPERTSIGAPAKRELRLSTNRGLERANQMASSLNGSPRLLYSVGEVSGMFGISAKSVYRLLDRGLLKSSSALRHKRISKASIDEFIAKTTGGGG